MLHNYKGSINAARGLKRVTWADMTNNGYQVVTAMRHIKTHTGGGNDLGNFKSLRGQFKFEFALQLNVDRGASFTTAKSSPYISAKASTDWPLAS